MPGYPKNLRKPFFRVMQNDHSGYLLPAAYPKEKSKALETAGRFRKELESNPRAPRARKGILLDQPGSKVWVEHVQAYGTYPVAVWELHPDGWKQTYNDPRA